MTGIGDIDRAELERRRERVRRAWAYRRVDHPPIVFALNGDPFHTLRELCESGEVQVEANGRPGGRLHNRGPHPAADLYLDLEGGAPINGLNGSFRYTRGDFPSLREVFLGAASWS